MKIRNETYTNSVLVATAFVAYPGLGADRTTIPADNATPATLHYRRRDPSETAAVIIVNNASVTLAGGNALDVNGDIEFEIVAPQVGPIDVTVNADSLTLTAT